MTIPPTPVYTPVTAGPSTTRPDWPSYGLNETIGNDGILAGETLPILAMESGEPLLSEDNLYLFEEGL